MANAIHNSMELQESIYSQTLDKGLIIKTQGIPTTHNEKKTHIKKLNKEFEKKSKTRYKQPMGTCKIPNLERDQSVSG